MDQFIFDDTFKKPFFLNNFGKKYIYKEKLINNFHNVMSIKILNELLSNRTFWNNKNFLMKLDTKTIKYSDYSSMHLETSGNILRPDVDMVQDWLSRGASIVLNEIDKTSTALINLASEFQNLTQGRCQGNLYFSMDSRQAFGPHCDEHDVFAVHFEGEKIWNIYENIELNPINHPIFKFDSEERIKRAGKLIDQVTLKPGDFLYLPRGQYHDALASKNGAIHIAFGLTYFKPIDLMSVIWEKMILNDFMRQDINQNITKHEFNNVLKKISKELENIINTEETNEKAFNSMKNWSYKLKNYSLKKIISEGRKYKVSKIVKIEKTGKDSFLVSGKDKVSIPSIYSEVTDYILKNEFITYESVSSRFNKLDKQIISDCIEKLNSMKVII